VSQPYDLFSPELKAIILVAVQGGKKKKTAAKMESGVRKAGRSDSGENGMFCHNNRWGRGGAYLGFACQ